MLLFLRRYPLYVFVACQVIFTILYLTHSRLQPTCSDGKQYDWATPEVSRNSPTKLSTHRTNRIDLPLSLAFAPPEIRVQS